MQCSKCSKSAITFIRYSGMHLCKFHFIEFFEKRVKKELKKQGIEKNSKIAVALSGGKDSTVCLFILKKIFKNRKDIKIEAITVDEGISNYRDESIKIAKRNCEKWRIPLHIVSFKNLIKVEIDKIKPKKYTHCTYCGVFRRFCLNEKAKEIKANKLATGLNLDDTTQSILMNITKGDVEKLSRLGPHKKIQFNLIPRIQPLRTIPEKESFLYAVLNEIEFYYGECPYYKNAQRNEFRKILYELEEKYPGTRHAILSTYDNLVDCLIQKFPQVKLIPCKICGNMTSQNICKVCELKKELKE